MIKIKPNTNYKVASKDLEEMQRSGLEGATFFLYFIAVLIYGVDETKVSSLAVLVIIIIGFMAGANFQSYMTPRMLCAKEIPNAESTTPEGRGPENNNF